MIAPFPMLALKFKDYSIRNNINRYLVVVVSVALIIILGKQAFPIIISFYVALSLLVAFMDKRK